jgi:subtilisin family serine protease
MGPFVCHIPRDLLVGLDVDRSAADLWHLPKELWGPIWEKTKELRPRIAILDTGIVDHPDLPKPIKARSFVGGSVTDRNGHGTHCAGTALGRNGLGVACAADLLVGKVLGDSGGGSSDGIAQAIRWATDEGADVISMSLGGGGFYEPMRKACEYALSYGVIVVAAAGNSGFNGANSIDYPGKYLETICVGAFRRDRKISTFSSGGRELDIACPGQDIVSCNLRGGYVSNSGTSMATPFAAGLEAIKKEILKREGSKAFLTLDENRALLRKYAVDGGAPGRDDSFGVGIPDSDLFVRDLAANDIKYLSQGGFI